jgi:hypothetical protein
MTITSPNDLPQRYRELYEERVAIMMAGNRFAEADLPKAERWALIDTQRVMARDEDAELREQSHGSVPPAAGRHLRDR